MREPIDNYFMKIANVVATRGTCIRRQVGCVLINARNHIIATGYNGVAKDFPHCIDEPCKGADGKSGEKLGECEAIHAEQNAMLQCKNIYGIETCYSTVSPCIHCVKLLLNTSCTKIVFNEEYPHPDARVLWEKAGREWIQLNG